MRRSVMPIRPRSNIHRTKQAFVYGALRQGILRCELSPGQRLVIEDLARKLDVSPIPVREALHLLQSEGLVETVPHVGTTVAPLSRESILETFSILEGLQVVAARLVATRHDPAEAAELEGLVVGMDEALAAGRLESWAELNARFHVMLGALPGLPLLEQMTNQAFDRWDRVRRYFFSNVLALRVSQAQQEHHAIVAAIRARDIDAVVALVHAHSQSALAAYLEYLDQRALADGDARPAQS